MTKITEALDVLKQFNVPKKQQNERSALALLALVSLKKKDSWKDAKKTFIRVHDMMALIKKNYNKTYAENSRETFRRQTLHQLEKEVGIVERNADDPTRPTNSPNTTWCTSDAALKVIKTYGSKEWDKNLKQLLKKLGREIVVYAKAKGKHTLSIKVENKKLTFSPGKHNKLQIDIMDKFRKNFCKDAKVVYVGDTAHKMLFLNDKLLKEIKFKIKEHDILPDIVLLDKNKKKLYLVEAVSHHGPVSNKRKIELNQYFSKLKFNKVFVSAFPDFKEFRKHVDDIAWETEVWLSDIPNHMIHFNGDKFLKLD